MRRFFLLLLFLVAAIPVFAASLPPELSELAPLLGKDQKGFETGLREYYKTQQSLAEAERESAALLSQEGKTEEAQAEIAKARERMRLVRQGYEAGLEAYPGSARLHNYYGELLYDAFGEQAAALKHWNLSISYDAKFSAPYNNLGLHYCHNGLYEEGLRNLDTALKLEGDNPDYLFNLTQIYLVHFPQIQQLRKWKDKEKVYKEAMKCSAKAAKLAPDDFEIVQDFAVNHFAAENFGVQPDWASAAKAWQSARNLSRTPDERFYCWLNEARVRIREGRNEEARKCLAEALSLRPQSEVAQKLMADVGGSVIQEGNGSEHASPSPTPAPRSRSNFSRPGPRSSPEWPRGRR